MDNHYALGKKGEILAFNYLIEKGYVVLHRNYRYLKAEIDIIAQKDNTLAIVEVKTRSSTFFKNIAETVTPKKIKLLVTAANQYVIEQNIDVEVRFDIITIHNNNGVFKIKHLKNAFHHF